MDASAPHDAAPLPRAVLALAGERALRLVWENELGGLNALLTANGVEPDPERTRYYRLLWNLSP